MKVVPESTPGAMVGFDADGNRIGLLPEPVYRPGATYICEAPPGAQLMTVDDKVIMAAPGHPPCYVTPTGLEPIPMHASVCGEPV